MSSKLLLSTLSAELVDRCSVGARGNGCPGSVGVSDDSRASDSDFSLLVDGHAHALPPQSGHLFHDLFFVFAFVRGRFHALLAAAEWSFVLCCLPSCVWWSCCGEGFLVSECIGRGPLLSSSTERVGVVGDFEEGYAQLPWSAVVWGEVGRCGSVSFRPDCRSCRGLEFCLGI